MWGYIHFFLLFFFITSERRGLGKSLAINTMTTNAMSEPTPLLPYNDVLGPDTPYNSSDDEPLVPVREKVKPVKRERSATATVEPDTKKATHVKRERSASARAEREPPTIVINDDVPKEASRAPPNSQDRQTDRQTDRQGTQTERSAHTQYATRQRVTGSEKWFVMQSIHSWSPRGSLNTI